jgi:hypothetical protein
MRARTLAVVATAAFFLAGPSRVAFADAKSDVAAKLKAAMEAYDTFDYDGARKQLTAAIQTAKKAHLDKDPVLAKAYLDLGIVAFAVPDQNAAKEAFVSAAQIDPKIQIDVAYKSPELAALLDKARLEAKTGGGAAAGGGGGDELGGGDAGGGADCGSVKGLQHQLVDSANGGSAVKLEAQLGSDVKASKVSIMFRSEGSTDFTEVKMSKSGCTYSGQIPSAAVKGLVHYYIAAYDGGGKLITSKGSAGSPNIIEVTGGGGGGGKSGDDEDPLNGKKTQVASTDNSSPGDSDTGVSAGTSVPGKPKKVWISVNGGTGGGYVTGTTEGGNTVKQCCIGENPVVLLGELGYNLSPQLAIGVAFRMGIPLGANLDGHSTGAPGGLVRVHYALADDGDGVHFLGELGFGFLRNTIKLDDPMMGMDTDVVAQGPLLVGGGVGYGKKLGDMVRFTADLNAILGLAVINEIGAAPMNNGVSIDASVGFQFGLF